MGSPIITQVINEMNTLPDDLQQQVLTFIITLKQHHHPPPRDAWDVLESLTGTIEAPSDWSAEHNHYLYGTPKRQETANAPRFTRDILHRDLRQVWYTALPTWAVISRAED